MKSTKVQTLGAFRLKTPLHALGEHTDMKTELYQTNVKSQVFIYRDSFQHKLH